MRVLRGAAAMVVAAVIGASGCDGEPNAALPAASTGPGLPSAPAVVAEPIPTPHACGLSLTELSIYQGIKIPLFAGGVVAGERPVPVVAGRQALVRAFVSAADGAPPGNARARLIIEGGGRKQMLVDTRSIAGTSQDGALESAFKFDVAPELVTADARIVVELELGKSCGGAAAVARLPAEGAVTLEARPMGTLKVVLVPVRYDADGSGSLPDISDAQLDIYDRTLMAFYPISDLQLTVHDPVATDIKLGADAGWGPLLDQLRELRAKDGAPSDVYYYGLVTPGTSFTSYCRNACTAGLSYLAASRAPLQQVGVGVGFGGQLAADTLTHELGHQHGRKHAPCGRTAGMDDGYPYEAANTGAWGFDFRSGKLMPPNRKDIMSYCSPQWISDYTYKALADRRAQFVTAAARVASSERLPLARRHRVLLVDDAARTATWGRPLGDAEPAGDPEPARVLDAAGRVIATVTVLRTTMGEGAMSSVLVPEPDPSWAAVQVGAAPPISFRAAPLASALRELR